MRNAYKILVTNPKEKRRAGRSRSKLEDNIKMEFRRIWFKGVYWIRLTQVGGQHRAYVKTVMNLWVRHI